jgi:hypothetical protein
VKLQFGTEFSSGQAAVAETGEQAEFDGGEQHFG